MKIEGLIISKKQPISNPIKRTNVSLTKISQYGLLLLRRAESGNKGESSMHDDFLKRVSLRPISSSHLEDIVEIDQRILGKKRQSFWKKKVRAVEPSSPPTGIVAELENKVIGFIFGEVSGWEFGVPASVGWIDTLGVDPKYQNRGVAKAMMEVLIKNFREAGVKNIYTLVNWDDWDLLQFFRRMGFTRGDMINLELRT
jgi:N-acetylglutamate synthase-like GNAT family acetyltransferase